MAKCSKCTKRDATAAGIVKGVYYKDICQSCLNEQNVVSSGHARWSRSIDAEDHEADIQQPWNADGTINTRFAKLYPRQAKAVFTPEELDRANRK